MKLQFDIFINFDGNCMEALQFYANVFKVEPQGVMQFKDAPVNPDYPIAQEHMDKVMYASFAIGNNNIMLSDDIMGTLVNGNTITLTLGSKDKEALTTIFHELAREGTILMPIQKTFWSDVYGIVQDKFGIRWQVSHDGTN